MAKPIRWVKLTLPPMVRTNWLLMMVRLTSSSLAGTTRTLVAVGTPSDASMLVTMRPAAPRRTVGRSPVASGTGCGAGATGAPGAAGVEEGVAAVAGAGTGPEDPEPGAAGR